MSRFSMILSDLDLRLAVPEPARSRVLLEVAADMEGLYRECLERGYSDEDAGKAVEDHFDLSDEALRELIRVHDTPFQRSLETLTGQVRGVWSRLLMAVLALIATVGSGSLLFHPRLYGDASGLIWITMPLLALGVAMAGRYALRVFRTGLGWSPALGSGLGRLLGLAALLLVISMVGLWFELYLSALRIRAVPAEALLHLLDWLHMASATLTISLSGALVLGFLWFFLDARIRRQELDAVSELLEGVS